MKNFICRKHDSLLDALEAMNRNRKRIVFIVDAKERLCGVLTYGDISVLLLKGQELSQEISGVLKKEYCFAREGESRAKLSAKFPPQVLIVPVIDKARRVVDYMKLDREESARIPISEPSLRGNEFKYLVNAFLSSWISSTGMYINRFEEGFAKFCGCKHGVATSNGTTALHLALVALDIGKGDEVIVPDLTFAATINTVLHAGATPVVVDVDKKYWTILPSEIEKAITPRTKAIMPVHIYGQPCDMAAIMKIAKAHKLLVIEDAAEAHGAEFKGRKAGSFGDISCFSFYANKVITTGEGGMCVTQSPRLYERMRVLRDHGMSKEKRYWHDEVGFNYRMTNLQAAIGCGQLETIEATLKKRKELEDRYRKILKGLRTVEFQAIAKDRRKITWLLSILVPDGTRDQYMERLAEGGVDVRPFFYSLTSMPLYKKYLFSNANSLEISRRGISLPTQFNVTDSEISKIRRIFSR